MDLTLCLTIMWAGLIFGISSIPGNRIPFSLPGRSDLLAHFFMYFVLGALVMWWRATGHKRPIGAPMFQVVVMGSIYGITDEFHQRFVPDRSPDPLDWVADTLGVAAGAIIVGLILLLRAKMSNKIHG